MAAELDFPLLDLDQFVAPRLQGAIPLFQRFLSRLHEGFSITAKTHGKPLMSPMLQNYE
ncbi:hypothetical protein BRAO375_3700030 [Bradyrhizobium sp. ORS 375]|nr:hypothetical protein BRAO375_3700030 [Bradyrhizobium sp. ORS 375]